MPLLTELEEPNGRTSLYKDFAPTGADGRHTPKFEKEK
jgi:hypothetical protein